MRQSLINETSKVNEFVHKISPALQERPLLRIHWPENLKDGNSVNDVMRKDVRS